MGNRIIKESICTSDSIDALTWFEEVFFYRLIVNCDDYGRMDARLPVLRARMFPLKDSITNQQLEDALSRLVAAGMATVYEYGNRPYLQLENWGKHQNVRNKKSKYPQPPENAHSCKQLNTTDFNCGSNPIQSVSESNPYPNPNPNPKEEEETEAPDADWNPFGEGAPPTTDTIEAYIAANISSRITDGMIDKLTALEADGATPELIRHAVDAACETSKGPPTWSLFETILRNWLKAGVRTVGEAKAEQERFKAGKEQHGANHRQDQAGNAGRRESPPGSAGNRYKPDPAEIERIARERGILP